MLIVDTCPGARYFYCKRVQIATCRPVQIFIVHVSKLPRPVLYKRLLYTCPPVTCVALHILLLYTWSCWHMRYCKYLYCARIYVDTGCTAQMVFVHSPTLTRVVPYKYVFYSCSRWHVSYCTHLYPKRVHINTGGTFRIVIVHVSSLTLMVLQKCFLYTRACLHLFYCTIVCCTPVHTDTCRGVQLLLAACPYWHMSRCKNGFGRVCTLRRVVLNKLLIAHLSMLTSVKLYKIWSYTCPVDTSGSAPFFVHVSTLNRVCLYKILLYTCRAVQISMYACPLRQVWYCTKFYCSRVHVDKCHGIPNVFGHVSAW